MLLLAYPQRMYQQAGHFLREALDNGDTIHAEPYVEPAPSSSPLPEQHEVGGVVIFPCNYIIRPLPSTYKQKLSRLRHTVSKTKSRKCLNTEVT